MHLATITVQGKADLRLTNRVISDEALQEIIFENVLEIIRDKGYVILWGNNIGTIYYYR